MKQDASKFLSEAAFWAIIERSLDGTNSVDLHTNRQEQLLETELCALSREEFLGFIFHFNSFFAKAYRHDLWAVAYIVMGGCSDDCFMDFRKWLVTRGKETYEAALSDTDSLCHEFYKIPDGDMPLWEYYVGILFDSRFGTDSLEIEADRIELSPPQELTDIENKWDCKNVDSLRRICPEVYAAWWENDRF